MRLSYPPNFLQRPVYHVKERKQKKGKGSTDKRLDNMHGQW